MDILKICSNFLSKRISKHLNTYIKKKTGHEIIVDINSIIVENGEKYCKAKVNLELYCTHEELEKILDKLGV